MEKTQVISIELEPTTKTTNKIDTSGPTPPPSSPTLGIGGNDENTTTTTMPTLTTKVATQQSIPSSPITPTMDAITINHTNPIMTTTTATTNQSVNSDEVIEPASLPSTSRQYIHEAAKAHGGIDTTNFVQAEMMAAATAAAGNLHLQQQPPMSRVRTASSTLDANTSVSRFPSTSGKHEKKIGHRRVDEGGEVTYKRIQSKQIMGSIQLGIQHTVGSLASKPKRDLLMNDFYEMEAISFPAEGSSITPAHHYNDFRFKVYAPIAFRYFRDLFGIAPDDFLMSMCAAPLLELSNPGASGSIFYLSNDDEFIIKTVQKKECEFLQKLLPGYYMNLSQNPRTLLPKFFGLWCFHYNAKNVRLVAMNNLLPSDIKMHAKYDLKGSTFRRKASKAERQKASPTFKDLDFMEHHPNGVFLETDKYNALMKTIQRDCMVLESFQIMDYSLLVGIHNLDIAAKEKREERIRNARAKLQKHDEQQQRDEMNDVIDADGYVHIAANSNAPPLPPQPKLSTASSTSTAGATALNRTRSMNRPRLVAHSTAIESITADMDVPIEEDEDVPAGGIPARSENDERLILYIGIIDILQSYRLEKKLEHTFKSIIYNGDTVSVCRPSFYAQRFQNFMGKTVFKKTPTFPLKHSPSKRKTSNVMLRTPLRNLILQNPNMTTPSTSHLRQNLMTGSSTPPPAFDDISEEDITANSSTTGVGMSGSGSTSLNYNNGRPLSPPYSTSTAGMRGWHPPPSTSSRSRINSTRSMLSSVVTDDYGDTTTDDEMYSSGGARSPASLTRSPRLSKTNVQLTTIGCIEDGIQKPDNRIVVAIKSTADADGDDEADESNNTSMALVESTPHNSHHHYDENGGNRILDDATSTTKTTVIKAVKTQTYTSTLVVNDVIR